MGVLEGSDLVMGETLVVIILLGLEALEIPIETHRVATIEALVDHLDEEEAVLMLTTLALITIFHRIVGLINTLLKLRGDMIRMGLAPALLQVLRRTVEHPIQLVRTLITLEHLHHLHHMGLEETPGLL